MEEPQIISSKWYESGQKKVRAEMNPMLSHEVRAIK